MPATVTLHSVKGLSPVHKPTQEQADAIDNFKTGQNLKINAFAGTGKTSTLQMLGECSSKRGLYLAFNRSIADDAQKRFPSNITCQTTHSLAYRATPSAYRTIKGKMTNRYYGNQIAQLLNLKQLVFGAEKLVLRPNSVGYLVAETINRFTQSADTELSPSHVPDYDKFATLTPQTLAAIKQEVARNARSIWKRMVDPTDAVPLGHDGYLKRWALSAPNIPADFLLIDEAQDTNPVMLGVLAVT